MPRQESEEEEHALPPTGFSTPTKADCNAGAGHADAGQNAKETEAKSDADVEKQFDESTGKKRNYAGLHPYRFILEWDKSAL